MGNNCRMYKSATIMSQVISEAANNIYMYPPKWISILPLRIYLVLRIFPCRFCAFFSSRLKELVRPKDHGQGGWWWRERPNAGNTLLTCSAGGNLLPFVPHPLSPNPYVCAWVLLCQELLLSSARFPSSRTGYHGKKGQHTASLHIMDCFSWLTCFRVRFQGGLSAPPSCR